MSELANVLEQLERDHRNHGCDTWEQHMADCEWLARIAREAERVVELRPELLGLRNLLASPVVVHGRPQGWRQAG